jgi:hypothetical protein
VESGRTLRRRWILTSFLFLLTLFVAAAAWVKIPGPYQAESMIVLYPSKQAAKINGNNPLMSFGGSLNVAGDIVLREVSAPTSVATLAAKGYSSSFTIADDPNTTGPILDVTVTGKNQDQVENTLRGVTAAVQARLNYIQGGYQQQNRITSAVVSIDPTPKLLVSKKARNIVIILGLGLVLTFAIPLIVDGEIGKRRGDRDRRASTTFASATEPASQPAQQEAAEPEPAERAPQPQPAYYGTPGAPTPPEGRPPHAEPRAPRYGVPARPDYAPPRADQYQAGRPDQADEEATERRRYSAPPPGSSSRRNGPGDGGGEDYQSRRQSENSRS